FKNGIDRDPGAFDFETITPINDPTVNHDTPLGSTLGYRKKRVPNPRPTAWQDGLSLTACW
ncbi:MAG: hypothetical protein R6U98_03325, partial [Pirellulaceae bacterium]